MGLALHKIFCKDALKTMYSFIFRAVGILMGLFMAEEVQYHFPRMLFLRGLSVTYKQSYFTLLRFQSLTKSFPVNSLSGKKFFKEKPIK